MVRYIYSTANENHNEIDVRSTFTIQSYVRIDRLGIDYQSSISPISSFTCRSFNRLNHSYCFIDPFIPQKYEIEKRTKFTKVHKVSDAFYLFNLFIYLFIYLINAIISYILIVRIGMSLVVIKFYFSCKTITIKCSLKMSHVMRKPTK